VADWLWLRSGRMQDEGNYFEMVQLASWIVKLQPRFTGATAFLAWNMSYNISVTFHSFEDRWRWVRRGIELIRDEALVYNPGDPELFRELGWIYQHKLGQDLDDANRFYKTEMANELMKAMGKGTPDWAVLAAAPKDLEEVWERTGADPNWLESVLGELSVLVLDELFRENEGFTEETAAAIREKDPELLTALDAFLRSRWLRDVHKLEPSTVLELNNRFGPLDWRLPEAHAIYWASLGLAAAGGDRISLSCDRMIFQSLNAAFKGGRLVYVEDIQHLETAPNLGLVDAVDESYHLAMEKHGEKVIKGAYLNFVVDAAVILYTFGQRKQAQKYFEKGREAFGPHRFGKNLDEFVLKELALDMALASYKQAQGTIQGYLIQTCHALAIGETDRAVVLEQVAKKLWHKYQKTIGETTHERRGLPPYAQMKRNVVERSLRFFAPGLAKRLRLAVGESGALPRSAPDESGPSDQGKSGTESPP